MARDFYRNEKQLSSFEHTIVTKLKRYMSGGIFQELSLFHNLWL